MLTDGPDRGGTLVVLGELDKLEMREEMVVTYGRLHRRWPRVRFYFWQGKPHELDDLGRVSAAAARHIIVLGNSPEPRVADSLVSTQRPNRLALLARKCSPRRRLSLR